MSDVCPCHGVPWYVRPSGRARECIVKRRKRKALYAVSEKGRKTNRKAQARYKPSEKGRKVNARYNRGRGYVTRRRRDLGRQREVILAKLEELNGSE